MQACSKCGHLLILYSVSDETECCGCGEVCPTPPALDAGESAVSTSSSHASAESTSQTLPKRTQRK